MYFNKLEKYLIKLLKLNCNNVSISLFEKAFNIKKMIMNSNSNSNNSKTNNDGNKKQDLNQPSKNPLEPGKAKKAIWTTIIILFVLAFFALVILSGFSFAPTQIKVEGIKENNDSSFIIQTKDGDKVIYANSNPSFYLTSSLTVEVTFGSNVFSSYYFSALLSSDNDGAQYLNIANYAINIYDKKAYKVETSIVNGDTKPTVKYTPLADTNPTLNKAFSTFFGGMSLSTSKPVPFSFTTVTSIIISLLPVIIIFAFLWWSMKKMGGATSGTDNVFSIGKSQAKLAQSNVLFSDVAGIEEEKEELVEIVDYLKKPEKYASMGARVPKGVILYGPPGTGKTLLAKAVAGEAKVPFFQVSGSAFEDMLVGVGAKRVRDLFSKAVKAAPAIIFIDEIDSVGSKRGKFETTAGSLADQTLNQLLAEMDGFSSRTGVIVIAATNRLDVLDDALLRPGRFDRHIRVNLPDIKERTAILKIHSRNKNISSSVDLEDIARRTPGFSGAQLENVLNEATILAVRKNKKTITTDDLDEAIDRVIAGPAKKTRVISLDEKRQIAYHEAGHAIVGLYTKGSEVVEKITIIPRGQAAGYTLSVPEIQELSIQKKSDLMGMIAGLLGGRASEEIVFGKENISTGAANDLYKATNIVRSMVTQLGMSSVGMAQYYPSEGATNPYQSKLFSDETSLAIDKEIEKIFKERYEYSSKIIKENRKELDLIVESLLLLETIVKPQIDYIHKFKKLPKEALDKKTELENKKKSEALIKKAKEQEEEENQKEKLDKKDSLKSETSQNKKDDSKKEKQN